MNGMSADMTQAEAEHVLPWWGLRSHTSTISMVRNCSVSPLVQEDPLDPTYGRDQAPNLSQTLATWKRCERERRMLLSPWIGEEGHIVGTVN